MKGVPDSEGKLKPLELDASNDATQGNSACWEKSVNDLELNAKKGSAGHHQISLCFTAFQPRAVSCARRKVDTTLLCSLLYMRAYTSPVAVFRAPRLFRCTRRPGTSNGCSLGAQIISVPSGA